VMNERDFRNMQDDEHAMDLAVDIIVERLEEGDVVQSSDANYTYADFLSSGFYDIDEYAEDIAQKVLQYWAMCKESGE